MEEVCVLSSRKGGVHQTLVPPSCVRLVPLRAQVWTASEHSGPWWCTTWVQACKALLAFRGAPQLHLPARGGSSPGAGLLASARELPELQPGPAALLRDLTLATGFRKAFSASVLLTWGRILFLGGCPVLTWRLPKVAGSCQNKNVPRLCQYALLGTTAR